MMMLPPVIGRVTHSGKTLGSVFNAYVVFISLFSHSDSTRFVSHETLPELVASSSLARHSISVPSWHMIAPDKGVSRQIMQWQVAQRKSYVSGVFDPVVSPVIA